MITPIIGRVIVALLFFILNFSCDNEPVGYSQLEREVEDPVFLNSKLEALESFGKYVPNGKGTEIFLGKKAGYLARAIIKFPFSDSALSEVSSLKLILYTKTKGEMNFSVYPVSQDWNEEWVTWKKTDEVQLWSNPGGDYFNTVAGSGRANTDSVLIELRQNLIDTIIKNPYGLLLIPNDSGLVAFYSKETAKRPKVIYQYPNKEKIFVSSGDASLIDTMSVEVREITLRIGSGFSFRGFLKFNLDTIPEKTTIVKAELSLYPKNIFFSQETLEIGVNRLLEPFYDKAKSELVKRIRFPAKLDSVLTIDIRSLIQTFATKPDSNFGLFLTMEPEYGPISRVEFWTYSPKLPRLSIGYILPAKDRFR